MEYFGLESEGGFVIQCLMSNPIDARILVIHVHGFGGDFISNRFVQKMHSFLPTHGIAFLSFNHRLSGYIVERYSEHGVLYCGASISEPESSVQDLRSLVIHLEHKFDCIVLQGHSFGTNIVKNFIRMGDWDRPIILLGPSDSQWLYNSWLKLRTAERVRSLASQMTELSDADAVVWDLFGITVDNAAYQLPISSKSLVQLLSSPVFLEWSGTHKALPNPALVVFGANDHIAQNGRTGNKVNFQKWFSQSHLRTLPACGHVFTASEDALAGAICEWIEQNVETERAIC